MKKRGYNVLSLFSGIECGREAFKRVEIKVNEYYSSEIDQHAIQVANKNHPDIVQLGDIKGWKDWGINYSKIDIVIGGNPCQSFSIAGKKLNFEDKRGQLFYVYKEILDHIRGLNPEVKFLLENVRMKDEIADVLDTTLGVKRVYIDSRYFTGHIRKRYYWTNIEVREYEKKEIKLKEIIEDHEYDRDMAFYLDRTEYAPNKSYDGIITINPRNRVGKQTWQRGRVYDIEGNCPTICASLHDLNITKDHKRYRKLTSTEKEKLQGLPAGYTEGISETQRGKCLGNGWTVDVIAHILKGLKYK